MTTYPKGPVFPEAELSETDAGLTTLTSVSGISIREYFAALAMQAVIASDPDKNFSYDGIAIQACLYADSLIAALNKGED